MDEDEEGVKFRFYVGGTIMTKDYETAYKRVLDEMKETIMDNCLIMSMQEIKEVKNG